MIPETLLGEAIQAGVGVLAIIALIIIVINNNSNMNAMIRLAGAIAATSANIEKRLNRMDDETEDSREKMRRATADLQSRLEAIRADLDLLPDHVRERIVAELERAIKPSLEAQEKSSEVLGAIETKVTSVIQTVQLVARVVESQGESQQAVAGGVQMLNNSLSDVMAALNGIQADIEELKAVTAGTQQQTERLALQIEAATSQ